jgi:hypothetical protein
MKRCIVFVQKFLLSEEAWSPQKSILHLSKYCSILVEYKCVNFLRFKAVLVISCNDATHLNCYFILKCT